MLYLSKPTDFINSLITGSYIYPLSWEDPDVDQEILNVNTNDTIIGITTIRVKVRIFEILSLIKSIF